VKQNGKHRVAKKVRKIFNQILQPKPALSLVELLVALTILALLSTAGLKMFQST
jgi:prepilin-type N-terminal cleavage/methylation domain-containing protein